MTNKLKYKNIKISVTILLALFWLTSLSATQITYQTIKEAINEGQWYIDVRNADQGKTWLHNLVDRNGANRQSRLKILADTLRTHKTLHYDDIEGENGFELIEELAMSHRPPIQESMGGNIDNEKNKENWKGTPYDLAFNKAKRILEKYNLNYTYDRDSKVVRDPNGNILTY